LNAKPGWLESCRSPVEKFARLDEVVFAHDEVLLAVGSMSVDEVRRLDAPVLKARYCHGFSEHLPELTRLAWNGDMPTITVSPLLVRQLEAMSQHRVWGVVPNAICPTEYFLASQFERNGIGTIYNSNPKKAPEDIICIMHSLRRACAGHPLYAFGAQRKPWRLATDHYWARATVDESRELYNRCKVFFVASKSEGFCLPILEAMACGAVVVSTDHDTAPGLIQNGKNGLLVPVGDVNAMVDSIRRVLTNDTLRTTLVRQGLKTVTRFSWGVSAMRMADFIEDVRAGWRPGRLMDLVKQQ
jgi:glycosyltransferase involved in cell wall biosynthesis